jgi:hypothetical protein
VLDKTSAGKYNVTTIVATEMRRRSAAVLKVGIDADKRPAPLTPEEVLHLARQVYADLSSEEIEAVEAIVLDRSHFSRPEP